MHILLITLGTDGDIFPFVGIGTRLRARGHRVTLVSNERYRALAEHHGFGFHTYVSEPETAALLGNPDLWHPFKSHVLGVKWTRRNLAREYEMLLELARGEDAVMVAYSPVLAARLVQETLNCPLVSIAGMPWMILSDYVPPLFSGLVNLPSWTPHALQKLYIRSLEIAGDFVLAGTVNRIGKSAGLKPARRLTRWWHSPQLTIGMFPEWYGPRQPDWPPQLRLAGFPLFDGGRDDALPQPLLDFCRAGKPPVAFTFGTGNMHAARMFRECAEACRRLNIRGIFLTKFAAQLPPALPPEIHPCSFASFKKLFPQCAAVVHHGGIGTTSQALAAGIPQSIMPLSWDQPDNAARIRRLNAGSSCSFKSSGAAIARSLEKLLIPEMQAHCREIAERFANVDALERAARWIEEIACACRKVD